MEGRLEEMTGKIPKIAPIRCYPVAKRVFLLVRCVALLWTVKEAFQSVCEPGSASIRCE